MNLFFFLGGFALRVVSPLRFEIWVTIVEVVWLPSVEMIYRYLVMITFYDQLTSCHLNEHRLRIEIRASFKISSRLVFSDITEILKNQCLKQLN